MYSSAIEAAAPNRLSKPTTSEPKCALAVVAITLVGVGAAVIVFAIVARIAADPLRTFTFVVAPIGLIVSWLFDVALYVSRAFPGTTGRGALALMSLHAITGVITVVLLRAQGLHKASVAP